MRVDPPERDCGVRDAGLRELLDRALDVRADPPVVRVERGRELPERVVADRERVRDPADRDPPERELVDREPERDDVDRELVERDEPVEREPPEREVVERELPERDLVERELVERDEPPDRDALDFEREPAFAPDPDRDPDCERDAAERERVCPDLRAPVERDEDDPVERLDEDDPVERLDEDDPVERLDDDDPVERGRLGLELPDSLSSSALSSSSSLINFFATVTAVGIATPSAAPAITFCGVDRPSSASSPFPTFPSFSFAISFPPNRQRASSRR